MARGEDRHAMYVLISDSAVHGLNSVHQSSIKKYVIFIAVCYYNIVISHVIVASALPAGISDVGKGMFMSGNDKMKAIGMAALLVPSIALADLKVVDSTAPSVVAQATAPLKIVPKEEKKLPVWVIQPQSSLRAVIGEFAKTAGWVDEWDFKDEQTQEDKDLILGGGMRVIGDFKTAIREIIKALPDEARICADLRPDNDPPTVFIVRGVLGGGCK